VARTPEATLRWSAGTALMIEAVFGEANMPLAMPLTR
jgi:hypothetical protein